MNNQIEIDGEFFENPAAYYDLVTFIKILDFGTWLAIYNYRYHNWPKPYYVKAVYENSENIDDESCIEVTLPE